MFLRSNRVRVEVLTLANHTTKGEKQGCYLFHYAITYFKIRVVGVFFQGSFNKEGCLSFFLLEFFPCWLPEIMFVYAEVCLGRLQQYYCRLTELRSESSSGQRRETRFKHADSGLFYSFTCNLFSFVSKFANRIFDAWLLHRKVNAFRPFSRNY